MLQLEARAIQNTETTIFNSTHSYSYSVLTDLYSQMEMESYSHKLTDVAVQEVKMHMPER